MQPPDDVTEEWIDETTVGGIGSWSVGVSNIWERDYTDCEGKQRKGVTACINIWHDSGTGEREYFMGEGSVMDLGADGKWKMVKVVKSYKGDLGRVWFRRV